VTVALHHVDDGSAGAPPLVLGNALGTATAMWEPVVAELGGVVRAIRYDHRGQGASPEPPGPYAIGDLGADVLALLDHLGLDRVAYAGVSIGGMVGLWLAAHAPERIGSLMVFNSSAHPNNPDAWLQRAAAVRAAEGTATVAEGVVARWTTPAFAAAHPEVVDGLGAMLLASPADGYVALCDLLAEVDLREDLGAIRAPTLVVGGAGDEAIPPEHARAIADGIAGARFVLLDPSAHIPTAERPEAVAALIREHLELPPP
jgi:3-oxoadipate enol-lactonase